MSTETEQKKLSEELSGLLTEHHRIGALVDECRRKIKEIKIENARSEYGVSIGAVVVNPKGHQFQVSSVDPGFGKPWVTGNPRKKNGEWSLAERNLYSNWELATGKEKP
jgi:hypothetical protein